MSSLQPIIDAVKHRLDNLKFHHFGHFGNWEDDMHQAKKRLEKAQSEIYLLNAAKENFEKDAADLKNWLKVNDPNYDPGE